MKHAYVVTEAVPGMHGGLPNVRDHDLSIYLKAQGDALALGGYETNPEFWRMSADDERHFSFGLFDLDWETFDQNIQHHMHRCPSVEDAGIKSTVCGPESFTVWKSTTGLGGPHQTSELSISVKSTSIRLIFGRIDCSRRVLEAQRKSLVQTIRLRAH